MDISKELKELPNFGRGPNGQPRALSPSRSPTPHRRRKATADLILRIILVLLPFAAFGYYDYFRRTDFNKLLDGLQLEYAPTDVAPLFKIFASEPAVGSADYRAVTEHALSVQQEDPTATRAAFVLRAYQECIDHGEPLAMLLIGDAFRVGYGVPVNLTKALYWYKRAADAGNLDGQYLYARAICDRNSVHYNGRKIFALVKDAADKGHALSQLWYADILLKMGAEEDAMRQRQKAAASGSVVGKIRYAQCLVEGIGVFRNVEEAYEHLYAVLNSVELSVDGIARMEFKNVVATIFRLAALEANLETQKRWRSFAATLGFNGSRWTQNW
jgi:class 3 adenylate cyclase